MIPRSGPLFPRLSVWVTFHNFFFFSSLLFLSSLSNEMSLSCSKHDSCPRKKPIPEYRSDEPNRVRQPTTTERRRAKESKRRQESNEKRERERNDWSETSHNCRALFSSPRGAKWVCGVTVQAAGLPLRVSLGGNQPWGRSSVGKNRRS